MWHTYCTRLTTIPHRWNNNMYYQTKKEERVLPSQPALHQHQLLSKKYHKKILEGKGVMEWTRFFLKILWRKSVKTKNSRRKETKFVILACNTLDGLGPQFYEILLKILNTSELGCAQVSSTHKNTYRGDNYKWKKVRVVIAACDRPSRVDLHPYRV